MKFSEFDSGRDGRLDEVGPLVSIANWFTKKFGAYGAGQKEVKTYVNAHMKDFMRHMGRYSKDWNELTPKIVYQYMAYMGLSGAEIAAAFSEVMRDPKVNGPRTMSMQDMQDNETLLAELPKAGIKEKYPGQTVAEMLVAAAVMKKLEKHWAKQSGADQDDSAAAEPKAAAGQTGTQQGGMPHLRTKAQPQQQAPQPTQASEPKADKSEIDAWKQLIGGMA